MTKTRGHLAPADARQREPGQREPGQREPGQREPGQREIGQREPRAADPMRTGAPPTAAVAGTAGHVHHRTGAAGGRAVPVTALAGAGAPATAPADYGPGARDGEQPGTPATGPAGQPGAAVAGAAWALLRDGR